MNHFQELIRNTLCAVYEEGLQLKKTRTQVKHDPHFTQVRKACLVSSVSCFCLQTCW